MPNADDPLSHYGTVLAAARCVDDSAIITTDVGQHQMWVAQAYPLSRPRRWLTSGGLGTMGLVCRRRSARRWRSQSVKCCASPATAA